MKSLADRNIHPLVGIILNNAAYIFGGKYRPSHLKIVTGTSGGVASASSQRDSNYKASVHPMELETMVTDGNSDNDIPDGYNINLTSNPVGKYQLRNNANHQSNPNKIGFFKENDGAWELLDARDN